MSSKNPPVNQESFIIDLSGPIVDLTTAFGDYGTLDTRIPTEEELQEAFQEAFQEAMSKRVMGGPNCF